MDNLICYKKTEIDNHGKLKFFLEKHSTKEGTWGQLSLTNGVIDFIFLNGEGQELSRYRLDKDHPQLSIPPAAWHKIIPVSEQFNVILEFYCMPQRYFSKKYGLGMVHSDLLYVYQTYLSHTKSSSVLDIGCGSGRNLLYLAKMGHSVSGIDKNKAALESLSEIAQQEALSEIDIQLHDLNHPLSLKAENYDIIFSTVSLQFLKPERVPDLLIELQQLTAKDGYHFLVFPIQADSYPMPDSFTYLPQKNELYHFYQDCGWSLLEYKESVGHLHKPDESGKKIPGVFGFLLAQKLS
ncbi:tellurite resistance protein TehB [Legionella quinlivanii]|uniref:Tellurite resistance protein TehB n=1 Tax=Legionella quinlivanii TaxID=45073 RepID=A0A0W0Y4Y0_9GAMM|nr:SAM-dependent methyltransferase TehB [Legionella quinlivanii]KTD51646.1 tellurite resistance protein TehB [Legionella quinlivanii]MCW8450984.1 SAM-dependent methyltransferase TehB [Legionella quinlivanii]SEF61783.1 tellurite methyltransferase [Legionella quinlivanii DSM 21216]STY10827.1 tellurite resistance protein TehB [Legionella quinlivanii]